MAEPQKRPDIMYEIWANAEDEDIKLENVMQYGGQELKDVDGFISDWIGYLGTKNAFGSDYDDESFYTIFLLWKSTTQMSDSDKKKIINHIDKLVQKNVWPASWMLTKGIIMENVPCILRHWEK